jgi:hypothetical protein
MSKKASKLNLPSQEKVEKFQMLSGLLDSIFEEMKEFSKKKPDELLNQLKVTMINKVLKQIKEVLSSEPTSEFLELLDDVTLPSNSDAVLIISQFRSAMEHFKNKFYVHDENRYEHRWVTQEDPI